MHRARWPRNSRSGHPRTSATVDGATPLGVLVTAHPVLARELERRGLDYCCGGDRTLAEACAERGLDVAATIDELGALAAASDVGASAWASLGVAGLVDHLEATHHRYLWEELPRLSVLVDRIVGVHGDRHRELYAVRRRFRQLRADLEPHLSEEERVLFPMARRLATEGAAPLSDSGNVGEPISLLRAEHDQVGELLAALRRLTDGFRAPPDACTSYRACYTGLAELESDTHLHVHKENNVLFPAVERLQRRLGIPS